MEPGSHFQLVTHRINNLEKPHRTVGHSSLPRSLHIPQYRVSARARGRLLSQRQRHQGATLVRTRCALLSPLPRAFWAALCALRLKAAGAPGSDGQLGLHHARPPSDPGGHAWGRPGGAPRRASCVARGATDACASASRPTRVSTAQLRLWPGEGRATSASRGDQNSSTSRLRAKARRRTAAEGHRNIRTATDSAQGVRASENVSSRDCF